MRGREGDILWDVWQWLPTFRKVAELQSVSRAALALSTSAPTISRAIAQLERTLSRKLFDRRGRRLVLNPQGEALLQALQSAVRPLAEAVAAAANRGLTGIVRLAAIGQYAQAFIVPVAKRLERGTPEVQLSISHSEVEPAIEALQRDGLDFYLGSNITAPPPLVATKLAEVDISTYAGRGHPLFSASRPTQEQVLEHPFVAKRRPAMTKPAWPRALPRSVTLWAEPHAVALEACLQGTHLMVMERFIAAPLVREGRLRELPALQLPPVAVVLIHRPDATSALHSRIARELEDVVRTTVASPN